MVDQNWTMTSGDDKEIAFTCYETDGTTTVDVSAATAATWALATGPGVTATLTKTLALAEIAVSSNVATVTLDAADTASLAGLYYHEFEIQDASNDTSTAAIGWVTIQRDLIA